MRSSKLLRDAIPSGETPLHYIVKADKDVAQVEKAKILLRHDPDSLRCLRSLNCSNHPLCQI